MVIGLSSMIKCLVKKSAPMVALYSAVNFSWTYLKNQSPGPTYWFMMELFPTLHAGQFFVHLYKLPTIPKKDDFEKCPVEGRRSCPSDIGLVVVLGLGP